MPVGVVPPSELSLRSGLPQSFKDGSVVCAIALALRSDRLPEEPDDAFRQIGGLLRRHGFTEEQGGVYFGGADMNAVTCVLAAQDLARTLPWFAASVRDIRMLRIEEMNDLMAAVQAVVGE